MTLAVVAAALAAGGWLGWAWQDNQKMVEAARAHLRAEEPERVGEALAAVHLTGVLADREELDALAGRAELWLKLRRAGLGQDLPPELVVDLQDLSRPEAEIRSDYRMWIQEIAEQALTSLEDGEWRRAEDSASASKAEDRARGFLEGLAGSGLSAEAQVDWKKRARAVEAEAREAREVREAAARLNPFGWEVVDATPGPKTGAARRLRDPKTGITFILVEPGSFLMGSPADEDSRGSDETQHRVTLTKAFYLGETEVTQAQWKKVMNGDNPSRFKGDSLPVEIVSWSDCQEFCRKAGYRLPTEAEWEYACRADTTTPFSFGATISTDQANYDGNYAYGNGRKGEYRGKTTPAGGFPANTWGFRDMHGNVWEWCQDRYGEYPNGPATDPTGPGSGEYRVLRGGSWYFNPWNCRSANRYWIDPSFHFIYVGFRAARTL